MCSVTFSSSFIILLLTFRIDLEGRISKQEPELSKSGRNSFYDEVTLLGRGMGRTFLSYGQCLLSDGLLCPWASEASTHA